MAKTPKKPKEKPINKYEHERLKTERTEAVKRARETGAALACVIELVLGLGARDGDVLAGVDEDDGIDDALVARGRIDESQWARGKLIEAFGLPALHHGQTVQDITLANMSRHLETKLKLAFTGDQHAWNTPEAKTAERLTKKLIDYIFETDHVSLTSLAPHAIEQHVKRSNDAKKAAAAKKATKKKAAKKKSGKTKAGYPKGTFARPKHAGPTHAAREKANRDKAAKKTGSAAKKAGAKKTTSSSTKAGATAGAPKAAEQLGETLLQRMRTVGVPLSVDALASATKVSKPTVLRALKTLRTAKKVTTQGGGRSTMWIVASAEASPGMGKSEGDGHTWHPSGPGAATAPGPRSAKPAAPKRGGTPAMVPEDDDASDNDGDGVEG